MEALFIYADSAGTEFNCSRYRVLVPAKYLAKSGHTIKLQNNSGITTVQDGIEIAVPQGIDWTDIPEVVLIERNVQEEWIEMLRLAGARRIVVTFDDNYALMQKWAQAKPWWSKHHPSFLRALALADLVIVPSLSLVDFYKPYCREIRYVPNYVDDEAWAAAPVRGEPKILGWGGSQQHLESWQKKKVATAIAKALSENQDWQLHLIGNSVPDFVNIFPIGTQIKWRDWQPYSEWPKIMSTFDIGLAPLNGQYDRYRSNLKLVEYGLGRVPWVASWSDPYTRTPVRGGILVKETDWYNALSTLMRDDLARATLAQAGKDWGDTFQMSRNVKVYEDLLWG